MQQNAEETTKDQFEFDDHTSYHSFSHECFRHNESTSSEAEDVDDDNTDDEQLKTFKTSFDGLNIKYSVPADRDKSYFKIKINDMNRFLHKSTACYLLTRDNNNLSTDRLSRVIQTSKK